MAWRWRGRLGIDFVSQAEGYLCFLTLTGCRGDVEIIINDAARGSPALCAGEDLGRDEARTHAGGESDGCVEQHDAVFSSALCAVWMKKGVHW